MKRSRPARWAARLAVALNVGAAIFCGTLVPLSPSRPAAWAAAAGFAFFALAATGFAAMLLLDARARNGAR